VSWFRSNCGRITCFALFALAYQVVLSFGHLHLGKVSISPIAVAADTALIVSVGKDSAAFPFAPPLNHSTTGDDFCAVCTSINLAASLVLPAVPTVVRPFSDVAERTWSQGGVEPVSFDHLLFEARGPPYA
jgi:hypothetical protein